VNRAHHRSYASMGDDRRQNDRHSADRADGRGAPLHFGTSGWRAVIAEEFTFDNVRRVVNAIAQHVSARGDYNVIASAPSANLDEKGARGNLDVKFNNEIAASAFPGKSGGRPPRNDKKTSRPVIVGYDTRFLSPELAQMTAEIASSYGIPVLLSKDPVPTPVISFQITHRKAAGSINFTASHNPAQYNGIKFNMANGAPASPEVTHEIERLANAEAPPHPNPLPQGGGARRTGEAKIFDPRPAYLARLRHIIDVSELKKARLKVGVDVLYGTGRGYLDTLLKEAGCQTTVLHDWRDVNFGGQAPEPAQEQLAELVRIMKKGKLVAGFGTDGDADRFGVVDHDGTLLTPNEILPIVLEHLIRTRRWKGWVVRSVMTSHFIDAVARQYGLEIKETPVGFKYIAEAMMAGGFLMGGEESGGLTIHGHVPEKDGILACLLMAEVRAINRKSFREILKDLRARVGPYLSKRINLHLAEDVMQDVRKRFETFTPNVIEGWPVKKIVRLDGFKFIFQDESWLGVRLSGTEPVVRLYLESDSPKKLKELEKIGQKLIMS
jgi:phosphoglucomutase